MVMRKSLLYSALISVLLTMVGLTFDVRPALADRPPPGPRGEHRDRRPAPPRADRRHKERRERHPPPHADYRRWPAPPPRHRPSAPRYPHYHDKHWYPPPRHHHYRGDDFWGWLAFTAVTLAIIDSLNEQQQREHELAMRQALRAPVGETIVWRDSGASGSVTVIREGISSVGRYCREYQQEVRIGGESQRVYGTACRNPDGTWQIMD
jgi:hypothetical protein